MSGPPSLRAAGHALMYWQRRQEVNANNLANVETPGFRAQRVFSEVLNGGLPAIGTVTDVRAGELRETGGPLDLALQGEGRFVVETPNGPKLVRSGSFALDRDGQVVDADGYPLMGVNGPLVLPPGPVQIDQTGGVRVEGELVGRVRVVRADERGAPTSAVGGGAQVSPALASGRDGSIQNQDSLQDIGRESVQIRQGYIEGSNVNALGALIEMTTIQRSFEAVQNTVRTIDSMMETVSNRLGRVE